MALSMAAGAENGGQDEAIVHGGEVAARRSVRTRRQAMEGPGSGASQLRTTEERKRAECHNGAPQEAPPSTDEGGGNAKGDCSENPMEISSYGEKTSPTVLDERTQSNQGGKEEGTAPRGHGGEAATRHQEQGEVHGKGDIRRGVRLQMTINKLMRVIFFSHYSYQCEKTR